MLHEVLYLKSFTWIDSFESTQIPIIKIIDGGYFELQVQYDVTLAFLLLLQQGRMQDSVLW